MAGIMDEETLREKSRLEALIRRALTTYDVRPRNPGDIYVTEVTNCLRRAFFNIVFNAHPLPRDSSAVLIGKALHELLPKVLGNVFRGAEYEVPVEHSIGGGWVLRGRIDMLHDNVVYEFKFGNPETEAKPLYIMQANAYANMVGADRYWLVIIDRRRLIVEAIPGARDERLWEETLRRVNLLISSIKKDIPPRGPDVPWECDNCPYNIICRRYRMWLTNQNQNNG